MTVGPLAARCSVLNTEEPTLGTALADERILIVEQPGAWGREAVVDSALDPRLIEAVAASSDGPRIMVTRHPRRQRLTGSRRWWALATVDSRVLSAAGSIPYDEPLPADPFLDPVAWPAEGGEEVFLCTNGRRDACCAEFGRALLTSGAGDPRLWEISHLGGHRFAPTALRLSDGVMAGRLDAYRLGDLMSGADPDARFSRGRVGRSPIRQVAEQAVADSQGMPLTRLRSTVTREPRADHAAEVVVESDPHRSWRVTITAVEGAPRAKSCGAEAEPAHFWVLDHLSGPHH